MTPQWRQHTRTRNPFHQGSRIRMFDEFGIDGLYDSGYEVAEGYLAVKDHGEFLFQPVYCWVMVESVDLGFVWGLRWRARRRSGPIYSYIHDASQLGCIRQRQKHGVQNQTRSRWTKKIGGPARARRADGNQELLTVAPPMGAPRTDSVHSICHKEQITPPNAQSEGPTFAPLKHTPYESHRVQRLLGGHVELQA